MQTKYSVSYLLMAYNQEKYVRQAVTSLFCQNLSGVEVIISDDCSEDETFKIIQEECGAYNGPAKIIFRQTENNLGVVSHLNELLSLAHGQLIIVAAGDDISATEKVARIVKEWEESNALLVGCNPEVINDKEVVIGHFYSKGFPSDFSCMAMIKRRHAGLFITGFDRALFDEFAPLDADLISEDQVLPFRAAMLDADRIRIIDAPLVKYRAHFGSMTAEMMFSPDINPLKIMGRKIISYEKLYRGWLNELQKHNGNKDFAAEKRELIRRLGFIEALKEIADDDSFSSRIRKFISAMARRKMSIWYILPTSVFALSPLYTSVVLGWLVRRFVYKGRERGV